MTQATLADLIDVPLPTLKALETGQRGVKGLSPAILEKIRFRTGATWNAQKRRWLFDRLYLGAAIERDERFVPVTWALVEEYRRILTNLPNVPGNQFEKLMRASVDELLKRISSDCKMDLLQRYMMFLEGCCVEFGLGEATELWLSGWVGPYFEVSVIDES
jgi:hypothetical protein